MKNFLKYAILLVLTFQYLGVYAQKHGNIEIIQNHKIDFLVNRHIMYNENNKTIPGYRIQIYFDSGNNSKNKANSIRNEFESKHSQISSYLIFQEPNYKIRVGDFRTRYEAQGFLNEILKDYPNAFIVKDEINFPRLINE
ncbi:MAG: SPOR domain-containing protein [Bacteroidota bacterium]|nr:SPOR domain-containing protein [Bacteroidota bacterium]